ncbi:protein LONGIFOLIA 2 isoform X2 [Rosa chinensis]|uniref:protein LONGIFOLIA 2 isoform X2 n=1 Tax=Rosa chinensis TaxID=74649 RepID=UPI000D093546|nr:protein LONGIFOLIA 2 isoform X2 [Rosa chinensis]
MAAKLLHSLADDNPDLQKQIGCMNGIFQIFDRHQVLTGRRISHHKRLPPGNSHYSNGGLERESNNPYHRQAVTGKHGIEKQPFQLPDFITATGTEKIRQGESALWRLA